MPRCSSERMPRSRCHWVYAAIRPDAAPFAPPDAASTMSHSPVMSARNTPRVSASTRAEPTGEHSEHTIPPSWATKEVCSPTRPQRAHASSPGAHPDRAITRSRYESRMLRDACSPRASARRPPSSRRYCCVVADLVRGLDHRVRGRVPVVVERDVSAVGAEAVSLLHDIERAPLVQQYIGNHEGLEASAEPRRCAAYALRHGANLAVAPAQ